MKTSTHLRKARALVNKGWCKGYMHKVIDGKDCYCMFGALDSAALDSADPDQSLSPVVSILGPIVKQYHGPEFLLTIVTFNDHPKTKKADVLAVYDLAIKKAVEDETKVR